MKRLVLSVTMMLALAATSAFAASTKSVRNTPKSSRPAVSQPVSTTAKTSASDTTSKVKRHRRHNKRMHKAARMSKTTPKKN